MERAARKFSDIPTRSLTVVQSEQLRQAETHELDANCHFDSKRQCDADPSASFNGLGFLDGGGWVPPHTQVAAGQNDIVEAVNLEMRVSNKAGGASTSHFSVINVVLSSLFNSAVQLSDPRVLYDGGHWYIATIRRKRLYPFVINEHLIGPVSPDPCQPGATR